MRVALAILIAVWGGASPLLVKAAGDAGKDEAPAAEKSVSAAAEHLKDTVKLENSAIETELQDLRSLVEEQREALSAQQQRLAEQKTELENQRAELKAQRLEMEMLKKQVATPTGPVATPVAMASAVAPAAQTASKGPALTITAPNPAQNRSDEVSPLQFKIGSAYITPVGFMDFTGVYRNHTEGTGIGTNFAGIKYGNSIITNTFNTHLSELRLSMQNSRIGFRVDALVKGAHAIGYMESDFLGNNPGSVAVSSNSNTLRSRLYWVDVQKGKWELLGGQTWSLVTPGRSGISPIPGDIFYTQNIDVNYQAGLVWGRIPELRFVVHPTSKMAIAVALDSPEQYVGGSAGGPIPTFPAALGGLIGTQLNNGNTGLSTPNVAPDLIAKAAFDPASRFHLEVGGLEREFKVWNSIPFPGGTSFSKHGAGGFVNLNVELLKGFRALTNNFWAEGGGRYIFGQVPDLYVRADDTLAPIKAASTVSGIEFTHGDSFLYAYYGGIYAYKNLALDTNGLTIIGYGDPTSTAQNRAVQEVTGGFNQTLWRDAKYGAVNFMGQYSYLSRRPWATFPLQPRDTHLNMVFLNLRYTLPGSAPTLGR